MNCQFDCRRHLSLSILLLWAGTALGAGTVTLIMAGDESGEKKKTLFEDKFEGKLGKGWSWVREDQKAWRVTEKGLEIRTQPGSVWGRRNNANNSLVRKLPDSSRGALAARVTVSDRASEKYEQIGIVWYYTDSHNVKLVKEHIDGKSWIVMGREENDRGQLVGKKPLKKSTVDLRLVVRGKQITGQFRPEGESEWQDAGTCDLPVKGEARISLQAYNGPKDAEHWARFQDFQILSLGP